MTLSPAYLLVAHGSRDPRPGREIARLGRHLSRRLPDTPVGTAALECQPQPLHQQLQQFSDRVGRPVHLLPLFLLPGVHVKEDIPEEVELARQNLPSDRPIEVLPYLGGHTHLADVVRCRMQNDQNACDAWILIAHGSRRPGGNASVENLVSLIDTALSFPVLPAYWSVHPSLDSQLQHLIAAGHRRIGIFPYFLCQGGITDAITEQLHQFHHQHPQTHLHLTQPLCASAELVDLLMELAQVRSPQRSVTFSHPLAG